MFHEEDLASKKLNPLPILLYTPKPWIKAFPRFSDILSFKCHQTYSIVIII